MAKFFNIPNAGYVINTENIRLVSPVFSEKEGRKKSYFFYIDFYREDNQVTFKYSDDTNCSGQQKANEDRDSITKFIMQ